MSNPSFDAMLLADSIQDSQAFDSPFTDRQLISVGDVNNGSYTQGQITFDLQSLSTSEAFTDLRGASLMIPFEMRITQTAATKAFVADVENAYSLTLKNCIYNIIDSLSLQINGTEVVSQQANSNIYNTYRLFTTWSPADAEALGPSYGFAKDGVDSLEFDTNLGEVNTKLVATTGSTVPSKLGSANTGRLRRARWQAVSADTMVAAMQTDLTRAQNLWMSTVNTGSNQVVTYTMFLSVPLKDLHPIFSVMPLLRKSIVKLVLNTNAPCSYAANLVPATGVYTYTSSNTPRGTFPVQITRGAAASGQGFVFGDSTAIRVECKIGNQQTNQCLFRCNRYLLSPEQEVKYLGDSVKTIRYEDYYSGIIKGVATSLNNVQIGSALSRVRRLQIFPYLTDAANKGVSPLASPWSSAPATTCPYWWASNLNVAVSGQNIYSQSLNYRYDQWLSEVADSGSLNGGYTTGVRSGLISRYDFDSGYGCIDINLSRHPAASDNNPQIISLTLKPEHSLPVDLYHFVTYEREFKIDVSTGALML